MPGRENEGTSTNEPEANKASNQNADPNFAGNMKDIKPEYGPEVEKAFDENVGSNKTGTDTRKNHDSNERQMGS